MILETQAASLWVANHLRRFTDLAEEQVCEFQLELQRRLLAKFAGHWYEDQAVRGSAFRSILIDCENNLVDELILSAAEHAGVCDLTARLVFLGAVRLFIDPREVVCAPERGRKTEFVIYRNGSSSSSPPSSPPSAANAAAGGGASGSASASASSSSTSPHRGYSFRRFHGHHHHGHQHHQSLPLLQSQQQQQQQANYRAPLVQYSHIMSAPFVASAMYHTGATNAASVACRPTTEVYAQPRVQQLVL